MRFKVELTRLENGEYIACVPGLPGCYAQGASMDQVMTGAKEAIEVYLKALNDDPGARTPDTQIIEVSV